MLYLFDIDGTLVDTSGAGMKALQEASLRLFGHEGPPLDLAGSTDLGVVALIHAHFGVESTAERIECYFSTYLECLDRNLAGAELPGRVLDGVPEILTELSSRPDCTLGLLTGNISGGAASKMRHFGLDHYFPFGAYGCDHADRNQLGPIALERASRHASRAFLPAETWVIGDTPKDIACAHAIGARCLAVATGRYSVTELSAAGADVTVPSMKEALQHLA
ncbi:HAD family hydrolase [Luteolibacter sp. SL250]|uniref:HAD family hydrolase n=1 Tax=Luteolibacter sp. SL250 TaxID=2995170 RepID=UPI002271448F|nr:HAD family hydrolase [Luteolibacter sp. SL250]WAC18651.1 HAD family hydrolase [Luteolibacter sp. SL250]